MIFWYLWLHKIQRRNCIYLAGYECTTLSTILVVMRFRQTQGKCRLLWHNNSTHFTCRLFTKVAASGIVFNDFTKKFFFFHVWFGKRFNFVFLTSFPIQSINCLKPASHLCLHWPSFYILKNHHSFMIAA